jgi:diguanylate cyclase (GGDEF)-like protein/PAS domain S-box-containing protein
MLVLATVSAISLALTYVALMVQGGIRGYIAGEAKWSKSQYAAVSALIRYGGTADQRYFDQYISAKVIPAGDRQAREELVKKRYVAEVARQGFLQGGVHQDDINTMIVLFRCCYQFPPMDKVVSLWEQGDQGLARLDILAQDLRRTIETEGAGNRRVNEIVLEIENLDGSIRVLAAQFTTELANAARLITNAVFVAIATVSLIVLAIAARFSLNALKRFQKTEARFRTLLNSASDAVILTDVSTGVILDFNPQAERLIGAPPQKILGAQYGRFFSSNELLHATGTVHRAALCSSDPGHQIRVEISSSTVEWSTGPAALHIVRDVSERIAAAQELEIAHGALSNLAEGVMILNNRFQVVSVNRAYRKITGYGDSDVIGKAPPLPRSRRSDIRRYRDIRRTLRETGAWHGELLNQRKGGEYYSELHRISCVRDDQGAITHFVCVFNDNTDVRESERKLRFLAQHDPLTKLLNRSKFEEKAKEAIENAAKTNAKAAVLFIDLDNFKTVNDTFGHAAGDLYLSTVGNRISGALRGTDLVGRVGGDEFSVLLPNINSRTDAAMVAAKLRDAIARQFEFDGHEISGSASVGLCLYPDDAQSVEQLLVHADAAMYEAKKRGRNNLQWFLPEMTSRVESKLALASGLRVAAQRGQLELHYQPCVDLRTGAIRGLEALLRWTHPELGRVSPGVFIPVAEEFGVIDGLTDFVLREACRQGKAWQDAGLQPIPIAINLSPRNFWDADLSSKVRTVLEQSGWPAKYLRLEITESTIMGGENPEAVMHQLRSLGVSLSIDDFGIGHSSLSSLQKFPVQCMKIDLSFTREIPENKTNFAITKTIISLAKNLGLELVAEGIETEIQAETLMKEGCAQGQGYYFCKPVPAVQIEDLLRDNLTARRFARQKVN